MSHKALASALAMHVTCIAATVALVPTNPLPSATAVELTVQIEPALVVSPPPPEVPVAAPAEPDTMIAKSSEAPAAPSEAPLTQSEELPTQSQEPPTPSEPPEQARIQPATPPPPSPPVATQHAPTPSRHPATSKMSHPPSTTVTSQNPTPSTTGADQDPSLEARIRDAVQAAVHYPAAARMMAVTGRARVMLDYQNGAVDAPSIVQSSGVPMLDQAAIAAAKGAHYPTTPAYLAGRVMHFLVWVEFRAS